MGVDLTPRRRNGVVPVLAQHATNTALENADLGSKTSIMTVHLRDYDRVSERATTPVQRNVLTAPKSDRSGSVLVPLGSRDELQIDLLVDALAKYGMPNGAPIGYLPA
ncbi:hypothetical protein [Calidifontibacter indicus]|uniref:hypothetical protein n=1 Tax=Calidifontibacter indicus TaxID=419650 RepID=UPI003D726766